MPAASPLGKSCNERRPKGQNERTKRGRYEEGDQVSISHGLGILHGLGLVGVAPKPAKPEGPVMLKDIGRYPRSARVMSQVLKGEKNWWRAASTLRSELKGQVPADPIGVWFHEGKHFEDSDPSELKEQIRIMRDGEALYFRLGVISEIAKKPLWDSRSMLSMVLGTDYPMVKEYIEARYDA